jgi:hypothetical protein
MGAWICCLDGLLLHDLNSLLLQGLDGADPDPKAPSPGGGGTRMEAATTFYLLLVSSSGIGSSTTAPAVMAAPPRRHQRDTSSVFLFLKINFLSRSTKGTDTIKKHLW